MDKKFLEAISAEMHTQILSKNNSDHILINDDSTVVLKKFPPGSIDLIITDPPYNIGLNYGPYKDKLPKKVYINQCKDWLSECARILTDTGTMYLISYPEICAYLFPFLNDELKLNFRRWLTWHYPTNIGHSKTNFTRSQRCILFYTKSNEYIFHREKILQHYKNPEVTKIKERIKNGSKGRASYDLLRFNDLIELNKMIDSEDILQFLETMAKSEGLLDVLDFNLLKNVSKRRIKGHPCQLPLGLLRVLINVSSDEGMWVLDPFAGTFTVAAVAAEIKRNSIGIELNPDYIKMGMERLK
jgi:adenine-specific DNA-methyltransferase